MKKALVIYLFVFTSIMFSSCAAKRMQYVQEEDPATFVKKKKEPKLLRAADEMLDHYGKKLRGELDRHPVETSKPPKGTFH